MSGFSAQWLSLREPADHAARSLELLESLQRHFAGHEEITVADLGCGTGSTLRAAAPFLSARQHWRLYDHDPALLDAAREKLSQWADATVAEGDELHLTKGGKTIAVAFASADLSRDAAIVEPAEIIAASALFDLVSKDWIEAFARRFAKTSAVIYAALNYDGSEEWRPGHEADAAMLSAFHAHQRTDKGFGPAAGPDAANHLRAAFEASGYDVKTAASDWRLTGDDADLVAKIAEGSAHAVRETGAVEAAIIEEWLAARRKASFCVIGHCDLLALPAG